MAESVPAPAIRLSRLDEDDMDEPIARGRSSGDAELAAEATNTASPQWLAAAFFAFGLLNNAPYVIILTAALEILPQNVPTGILAFVNIAPALVAKAFFPYVLKGEIRYARRILACTALSFTGLLTIAMFRSLFVRLVGIAFASFSSGMGEITYLQLSTRFPSPVTPRCIGMFSSGTGAAGLVGALAWWVVRPLGVRAGMSILSLLPFGMAIAYAVTGYERAARDRSAESTEPDRPQVSLTFAEKMELLTPMLLPFVLPLVSVYFAEYTINQGVAPTLLFHVPSWEEHPLLSLLIHSLRDYYPLYQLTYQTFVFLSRSYTSLLRLPAIPRAWLWAPAVVQVSLLLLLSSESVWAWFRESIASPLVIVLVAVEGLAGGSAYVSVFTQISALDNPGADQSVSQHDTHYQAVSTDEEPREPSELEEERKSQEFEFRIGCVGVRCAPRRVTILTETQLGDTLGIVAASLVSIPLQLGLCHAQVARGRDLCTRV